MLIINALRDCIDGLIRGFGLYLTDRNAMTLGQAQRDAHQSR